MSPLRQALEDYLAVRRSLGFKLERDGLLLGQYLTWLEGQGTATITADNALAWVTLPAAAGGAWLTMRMSVVRGFAAYARTLDQRHQVPPAGLLPPRRHRAVPYLYSAADIAALITAAGSLRYPLRAATYQALIALLSVTGLRIGEAISLDDGDFDSGHEMLTVRNGKFGKSRLIPLHPSTAAALRGYQRHRRELKPRPVTPALFVSTPGRRLAYVNVSQTFVILVRKAGLTARSASCHPRLHDLRH